MRSCNCPGKRVVVIDDISAEIRCIIHGTKFLFKNDAGVWQDGKTREAKLKRWHVCLSCRKKFSDCHTYANSKRTQCDECNAKTRKKRDSDRYLIGPRA